ncbi:sigma-70 family RNA polymerase sigma factor [Mumia zhuanghuii]|uniref:Sigma-70 family RNA polymerase sigma factor n=2 Tax=Mumia TaxID=1546255 RepID=A0ABW1QIU2_9ACTN|nr:MULTISPECIES: sigma-70 family RNA polymerase sigma factor [Mumia]KAA1423607.1 sigma-70 family RNA polymerase sigma factor [Mumia zhuanghuii]
MLAPTAPSSSRTADATPTPQHDAGGRGAILSAAEERALAAACVEGRRAAALLGDVHAVGTTSEAALLRAVESGEVARERLILAHVPLVAAIARRHVGRGVDEADLVQEGIVGLVTAVDGFDPSHGARFASYAIAFVRRHVSDAVSTRRTVRIPPKAERDVVACRQAYDALHRGSGRQPSATAVARRVGLAPSLVARLLAADAPTVSLDTAAALVVAGAALAPGATAPADVVAVLRDAVTTMPADQRDVIERRFGLDGGGVRPVPAVARELGTTTAWVRRTERHALLYLRRHPAVLELQPDGR